MSFPLAAVTVLTSHTAGDYGETLGRSDDVRMDDEVARLTQLALASGVSGVVASAQEVPTVRALVGPEGSIVVPGIRLPGADSGDQRRTASPEEAVRAGATHLVVGRPITQSDDPRAAFEAMREVAC